MVLLQKMKWKFFIGLKNGILISLVLWIFIILSIKSVFADSPTISQIIKIGNLTDENITAYPIATDPDNDFFTNTTWFTDNEHQKNVSFLATFDQPIPSNAIDNTSLTMSGFTYNNLVNGNSTNGDIRECIVVQGYRGRGCYYDGLDDYSALAAPENNITVLMWINKSGGTWEYVNNSINIPFNGTHLGIYPNGTFFNGTIDEVRIYSLTLTGAEQNTERVSPFPVKTSGLLESYSFSLIQNGQINSTPWLVNPNSDGSINNKGGAINLDGINDYVSSPVIKSINETKDFRISLDFNAKDNTEGNLLENGDGGNYQFVIGYAVNVVKCFFYNGSTYFTKKGYNNISLNTWYHVDCLYNSSAKSVRIFVNGIEGFNVTSGGSNLVDGFRIGSDLSSRYFNGSINNVIIDNYLLSYAQTLLDYNSWLANSSSVTLSSDETITFENWTVHSKSCDYSSCSPELTLNFTIYDCIPNFFCTEFSNCNMTDQKHCFSVNDSVCSTVFLGDTSTLDSTCNFCQSSSISICEGEKQKEEYNMLAAILLFVGLWALGYYTFQTGNPGLGTGLLLLSIPLDIWLAVTFQETSHLGSGFLGIGFSLMALFTLPLIVLIKRRVVPTH